MNAADRQGEEGRPGSPENAGGEGPPPPRGFASRGARPGARYSVLVGLAFVALVVVAGVNTLRTEEGGILGADPTERGSALPQFAVPDALGPVEGDANIYQDDCATSQLPCPADQRRVPACEIEGRGVIRVCDYFDRPLVISFWFTRLADCVPAQDTIHRLARRYRDRVNFISVNVRDEREEVRAIAAERGWTMPVGHDADGAVSNLYRVGVCPSVLFAYPGGILAGTAIGEGNATDEALADRIDALLRESRRRARAER